jgi:hypothetical protein
MDEQLKMDLPMAVNQMDLVDPKSRIVFQQLTRRDRSAAEIFRRANACPSIRSLDDDKLVPRKRSDGEPGKPTTDLTEAIKFILKSICVLTGLKITQAEAPGIIQMMKQLIPVHYGDLTHHEIVHAFELNSMAVYPATTDNPGGVIKHYQQFTIDYIGQVLKAYRRHRNHYAADIRKMIQAVNEHQEQKLLTAPPKLDPHKFIAEMHHDWQRDGELWLAGMTYQKGVEAGKWPENAFLDYRERARQKLIGVKAKEQLAPGSGDRTDDRGQITRIGSAVSLGAAIAALKIGGGDDGEVDIMAKKLCVIDYFKTL